MNISYRWLQTLVDCDLSPKQLAEKLSASGTAIEAIEKLPDGDFRLVAEITSNRGDCLGHYGIAREIAALTGSPVKFPEIKISEKPIGDMAAVMIGEPELCPRYVARVIKGVKIKESPDWLKQRLFAVGLRPINNIVDITNFILYEDNQPLHAFDFDKISGKKIIVRRARINEKFRTLTGQECILQPENLVIADSERVVALAGVMGGANSEVSASTTDIFLESAFFAPPSVRRTASQLKLNSDSSYRYERGIDLANCERMSARAAQLIVEVAGGEIYGALDVYPNPVKNQEISLRYAEVEKVLGAIISREKIGRVFSGLGLEKVAENSEQITVAAPPRRRDLEREIDLIEEIIRLAGFDLIPEQFVMPLFAMPKEKIVADAKTARETLARLGANEYVTDSFIPEKWEDTTNAVFVENPIDAVRPALRQSLLSSLLARRRVNRGEKDLSLFELNTVYRDKPRQEKTNLAVLDDRGTEFVFGAFNEVARALKIPTPLTVRLIAAAPFFAPRSMAEILLNDEPIGVLGIADVAQCKLHDLDNLESAPALGEIDFAKLSAVIAKDRVFTPLPRFPGIRRDLALVVPEIITWEQIVAVAREADPLDYVVESVYRGKGIAAGKKSVAFSFTYLAPDQSLTNEEANQKRDRLLNLLLAKIPESELR